MFVCPRIRLSTEFVGFRLTNSPSYLRCVGHRSPGRPVRPDHRYTSRCGVSVVVGKDSRVTPSPPSDPPRSTKSSNHGLYL